MLGISSLDISLLLRCDLVFGVLTGLLATLSFNWLPDDRLDILGTLSVTEMTLLLDPVPGVSEEDEELDMVEIGLPEMVLPRDLLLANDCTNLS